MKILYFIDPVIYRGGPLEYAAHFHWVDLFAKAVAALEGGSFALASSQPLCAAWISGNGPKGEVFQLNSVSVLADFQFDRAAYSAAVYSEADGKGYLAKELQGIRDRFKPDLILSSFQNSIAAQVFSGIPMVYLEQAPLPRIGHPRRVYFDPSGHQIGSTFELMRDAILATRLSTSQAEGGARLLAAVKRQLLEFHPNALCVMDEVKKISQIGKVAIFATQPPDGVTYEGAYKRVELESLICEWAQNLPPGWVGVPTYHFGKSLSIEMEEALAKSLPNVRFLPENMSRDHTELLLLLADGLVTISSTTAMSALLFQKPVVAVGRSPYNSWCPGNIEDLEAGDVLSNEEAVRLMVFLTNQFSYSDDDFIVNKNLTTELLLKFCKSDYLNYLFDVSKWDVEHASRLFYFSPEVEESIGTRGSFRWKNKVRDLASSLASLEREWAQAVKDRDGVIVENKELREKFEVISQEHDALNSRVASILSERDELVSRRNQEAEELISARAARTSVMQELEEVRASLSSIELEWRQAVFERDGVIVENKELREKFEVISRDNDTLNSRLASILSERDELVSRRNQEAEELVSARAARVSVLQELEEARASLSSTELEWRQAVFDRDKFVEENRQLKTDIGSLHTAVSEIKMRCSVLESEWKQAVSDRDSILSDNRFLRIALDKEHENLSRLQTELDRLRIHASHVGVFLGELAHTLRLKEGVLMAEEGGLPAYASIVVAAVRSLISENALTQLKLNESLTRLTSVKEDSDKTIERLEAALAMLLRKRRASKDLLARYRRSTRHVLGEVRSKCSDLQELNSQLSFDLQLTHAAMESRIKIVEAERDGFESKFGSLVEEVMSFKANVRRIVANVDLDLFFERPTTYTLEGDSHADSMIYRNLDDLTVRLETLLARYIEVYKKYNDVSVFIKNNNLIRLASRFGFIKYNSIGESA